MDNFPNFLKQAGKISGVLAEPVELSGSFLDAASHFADKPGTALLMSGGSLDCARYHILGVNPWLTFSGRGKKMTVTADGQTLAFNSDPFDALGRILDRFQLDRGGLPVSSGLLGYLAYDLKDCLEKLPRTSVDDLCLPHICFFAPSVLLVHDKSEDRTMIYAPERGETGKKRAADEISDLKNILSQKPPERMKYKGGSSEFKSNFEKSVYFEAIERIREYIASGDVYQVNMSQRFEMNFTGDAFVLFRELYKRNPAPFFAYVNAGGHRIVSTSPERFILRDGKRVETRPIKGTRPRGKTPDEDEQNRLELRESKKDDAELSMIVDLLRNDMGKVCEAGSVRVAEHKRLEAYQNVYHLVSVVEGRLDDGLDSVDLIRATFPGGSITGCPKIRSMEIIDELEPNRRHIYTGSIGYIGFHDVMDLSIAIRTATICNGKIVFSVGGGIVYDSNPADEYDETLHKGRTLIRTLSGEEAAAKNQVWINGVFTSSDRATVPLGSQGFQYGFGFFETIRVAKGEPGFLAEHTKRFENAWKNLFRTDPPDLSWEEIIRCVIKKNGLENKVAAVKIIAAKGARELPPFDHTLAVTARAYVHRLEGKPDSGLRAGVYPHPRETPLAGHKTLNYLYYLLAGQWAKENNFGEALITNPDGTISEANTANVLLIRNRTVIKPASSHYLPGVMEQAVISFLSEKGYAIEKSKVTREDCLSVKRLILTNSLMGAVPVLSINGKMLSPPVELCDEINGALL